VLCSVLMLRGGEIWRGYLCGGEAAPLGQRGRLRGDVGIGQESSKNTRLLHPPQIRTCGFPASGSSESLRSCPAKLSVEVSEVSLRRLGVLVGMKMRGEMGLSASSQKRGFKPRP